MYIQTGFIVQHTESYTRLTIIKNTKEQ